MYVSILNYRTGEVIIHSYSEDFDEDMEEFIADKLEHNDFHFMCSNELKLSINGDIE